MKKSELLKSRTIPFVFSDETKDSYGTVLTAKGWNLKYFNQMGVALYNHSSWGNDPDNVIGTARAWIDKDKKQLLGEITFETADVNPKAEKVFQKLLAGTIKGCSVGFRALKPGRWGEGDEAINGKNETYYYGERSLIEISVTPFPANPNAKVRSLKEDPLKEEKSEEIEYRYASFHAFDPEEEERKEDELKEEKQDDIEAEKMQALCEETRRMALLAEADLAQLLINN